MQAEQRVGELWVVDDGDAEPEQERDVEDQDRAGQLIHIASSNRRLVVSRVS